jgi:hypothetical protein
MADDAERRACIAEHPDSILVSPDMPLRANLSVLDNIALIPQYRTTWATTRPPTRPGPAAAGRRRRASAFKRDPDLTHAERFVAKLLRAAIGQPPVILVDRPGMLLPDLHYPPHLDALLEKLADSLNDLLDPGLSMERAPVPDPVKRPIVPPLVKNLELKIGLLLAFTVLLAGAFVLYALHARGVFQSTQALYPHRAGGGRA